MKAADNKVRQQCIGKQRICRFAIANLVLACAATHLCQAKHSDLGMQHVIHGPVQIATESSTTPGQFVLYGKGQVPSLYVAPEDLYVVRLVTNAFADDVNRVTGKRPKILGATEAKLTKHLIIIGTIGHSPLLDRLRTDGQLDTSMIEGKWESALTTVVEHPFPNVSSALVIAGSDRRGTAYAVFDLSRRIGVSPWRWWADIPVRHHTFLALNTGTYIQDSPSVRYRGIFLNDEDWGFRPWAARKMDPDLHNIGPHTYQHIFELLLRLRANTLWPAMHPGTLPFNAVPENALQADKWGIVMGSSHSEALLRNNVGEWKEKRDGPWNYQLNATAINRYWDERLQTNGKLENIYTVGMRGVHDSGLEATGSPEVKARLVEDVIAEQQRLLAKRVDPDVSRVPQVLWLYKESLELYRVGMKVPDDVTLGWTDDNYGYIRELPNQEQQARLGGSALYYHVSYFGEPHDYLWLCSTPPALMREELTKAWDHGVRQLWILNVGDLKPAEMDVDYFLRMAWDEPETAGLTQYDFLSEWNKEQFPVKYADSIARLMDQYYQLSFIRKPEFMGFNQNRKPIQRTAFNPLAWGDQNRQRLRAWQQLSTQTTAIDRRLPLEYRNAYFELTGYPIQAAAAQNAKFLWNDRSYLDGAQGHTALERVDVKNMHTAYEQIQALTDRYNSLAGGKWDGIMSSMPRNLPVFDMLATAANGSEPVTLPPTWGAPESIREGTESGTGFRERGGTISIDAIHFNAAQNAKEGLWQVRPDLGPSGGSVFFGEPGVTREASWVDGEKLGRAQSISTAPSIEYEFTSTSDQDATLSLYLLPTFPIDSGHRLRYAVILDGAVSTILDASGTEDNRPGVTPWYLNVLSNSEMQSWQLGKLRPGKHTLRLVYGDPGVFFEHIVITFSGEAPAYPFPAETSLLPRK